MTIAPSDHNQPALRGPTNVPRAVTIHRTRGGHTPDTWRSSTPDTGHVAALSHPPPNRDVKAQSESREEDRHRVAESTDGALNKPPPDSTLVETDPNGRGAPRPHAHTFTEGFMTLPSGPIWTASLAMHCTHGVRPPPIRKAFRLVFLTGSGGPKPNLL